MGGHINLNRITIIILAITLMLGIINSYQLSAINNLMPYMQAGNGISGGSGSRISGQAGAGAGGVAAGVATAGGRGGSSEMTPTGVPQVYGKELQFSFDDISPYDQSRADNAIKKLSALDTGITLSEKEKERYVNILFRMHGGTSCEYCCGAKAIIFENGEPACGCAHSYAMRGLAKYLVTKHGSEFTDGQILEEIGKLKVLFFPGQMQQKANLLKAQGAELTYATLASNKYRGIEQGRTGGGMVGGC